MKSIFQKYKKTIIGFAAGLLGGYLYFRLNGCDSGGCIITSSPFNSMAYFGFLGALVGNSFTAQKAKTNIQKS